MSGSSEHCAIRQIDASSLPVCLITLGHTFSLASAGVAWCVALLPTLLLADTRFRRLIAEVPRASVASEA